MAAFAQTTKSFKMDSEQRIGIWRFVCATLGVLSIFCAANFEMVSGMMQNTDGWRRTNHGWEYANALDSRELKDRQPVSHSELVSFDQRSKANRVAFEKTPELFVARKLSAMQDGFSVLIHFHYCLLATALATFVASLSAWFLVVMPNQSIVRAH